MLSINQQMRWRRNLDAMQGKIFWSMVALYAVERTNLILSDAELSMKVRSLISLFKSTRQIQSMPAEQNIRSIEPALLRH